MSTQKKYPMKLSNLEKFKIWR